MGGRLVGVRCIMSAHFQHSLNMCVLAGGGRVGLLDNVGWVGGCLGGWVGGGSNNVARRERMSGVRGASGWVGI